jgi:hypothetical protein
MNNICGTECGVTESKFVVLFYMLLVITFTLLIYTQTKVLWYAFFRDSLCIIFFLLITLYWTKFFLCYCEGYSQLFTIVPLAIVSTFTFPILIILLKQDINIVVDNYGKVFMDFNSTSKFLFNKKCKKKYYI